MTIVCGRVGDAGWYNKPIIYNFLNDLFYIRGGPKDSLVPLHMQNFPVFIITNQNEAK